MTVQEIAGEPTWLGWIERGGMAIRVGDRGISRIIEVH